MTMEEDDCVIINEHTVFDHIREKAKCFPSLNPLNPTSSPASGKSILKRKSLVENNSPELDPLFQYDSVFDLPTNTKDIKQSAQQITSPGYASFAEKTGALIFFIHNEVLFCFYTPLLKVYLLPPMNLAETERPFSDETIFNYIRKRSKNSPALATSKIENPITISSQEGRNAEISPYRTYGLLVSPATKIPRITSDAPSEILSFDISMVKRSDTSLEQTKGFCSTLAGKSNVSDSFLGFKSIFSFL